MKFCDCTLRDGGYYNHWDFHPDKARELIQSLNQAGVDVIELGYKSPREAKGYFGLFKYCPEEYLNFLSKSDAAEYAFMLDVKQWIKGAQVDFDSLDHVILESTESVFTWIRLASHYETIKYIPAFVQYFRGKGYKVGFNLMGGSLLTNDQIQKGAEIAGQCSVDVFYVADSFGSFYPEDIRRLIRHVKNSFHGSIGIHTHDNQGMAFANTLAALEEGVEFVDGTLTGMGRGAGNMHTEQFLLGMEDQSPKYNSNALVQIIDDYIQPLKDKYKWGYSPTYMFSGLKNIHPTYCQKLLESDRFTNNEIHAILEQIPPENRAKFSASIMELAISEKLVQKKDELETDVHMPRFDLSRLSSKGAVIIARGPSVKPHIHNLTKWAKSKGYSLIECNDTGFFPMDCPRFTTILNRVRLKRWLDKPRFRQNPLISGFPFSEYKSEDGFQPFSIGPFTIENDSLQLPDYDAGLYALALALKSGTERIFLAGFDGFEEREANKKFESYLQQAKRKTDQAQQQVLHITPTRYSVWPSHSFYNL